MRLFLFFPHALYSLRQNIAVFYTWVSKIFGENFFEEIKNISVEEINKRLYNTVIYCLYKIIKNEEKNTFWGVNRCFLNPPWSLGPVNPLFPCGFFVLMSSREGIRPEPLWLPPGLPIIPRDMFCGVPNKPGPPNPGFSWFPDYQKYR